jgi:DNA-binding CsgD family transcriptional regulator
MCLLSLIIPFISLIMINSNTGIAIIWALNYVFYGFFTVYRVIVMIDYALDKGQYHLIPVGLLAGRLGDALGTTAFIVLKNSYMYQTAISAALYCLTVLIFFRVYNRIYTANKTRNKNDLIKAFYKEYAISDREAEVMEMLLKNFNNKEIAEKLFVSVSTVKFHIHNILKKTSCANRKQLLDLYNDYLNQ